MHCPVCGGETKVKDTRERSEPQNAVRRTRQCQECNARFNSLETLSLERLKVRKRNDNTEAFSEDKLRAVLTKIIDDKNPRKKDLIEAALAQILARLPQRGGSEITATALTRTVMDVLRELDDVAFARFASGYHRLTLGAPRPAPVKTERRRRPVDDGQLQLFEA